jgi:hypothetical protein
MEVSLNHLKNEYRSVWGRTVKFISHQSIYPESTKEVVEDILGQRHLRSPI